MYFKGLSTISTFVISICLVALGTVNMSLNMNVAHAVQDAKPELFFVPIKNGDDLWGLVDQQGNKIAPPIYKDIIFGESESDPLLVQGLDDKWGYLTPQGNILHKIVFDDAFLYSPEGLARFQRDELWGFIKRDGTYLIEAEFEELTSFNHGYAGVKQDGLRSFINTKGETAFDSRYSRVTKFGVAGLAVVKTENEKIGVINQQGDWVAKPQYDSFGGFSSSGFMTLQVDDKWGVLDNNGNWVAKPKFDRVGDFSSKNNLTVEVNDKWGIIDNQGQWLLKPSYESIKGFNDLDLAIYSTDWNKHGVMDAQGRTLTDASYNDDDGFTAYRDFQLLSYEGSSTSFFSQDESVATKKLNSLKVGKSSGFNSEGLSIVNLETNSDWGILTVSGELFEFDSEVIEPYFTSGGDCHTFTATSSLWLPAITASRNLVFVDRRGQIGLRTNVLSTDTQDTLIVQKANGEELWRHDFPSGSLAEKQSAFLNISALELGYTKPSSESVKALVDRLLSEDQYGFDLTYLEKDDDSSAYGTATRLAEVYWGEYDYGWCFNSMINSARQNLDPEFTAYQEALESIYGEPIEELDEESENLLENSGIWSYEQSVWLVQDHLLVLNTYHSEDNEGIDALNLMLLPKEKTAQDAFSLRLMPHEEVAFGSSSSESLQGALATMQDKMTFSSARGLQQAVNSVFLLMDAGETISEHDYLRTQYALMQAAYYDSSELVLGSAEQYIAIAENTMRFLEKNKVGQNPLTPEGQFQIEAYRRAGNGAGWLLHESDPERALDFIEPAYKYISDQSSYLSDTYARALLNAGREEQGFKLIHKVLTSNPWYEYFEEYYDDSDFIKWRKKQGVTHPKNFEVPSSAINVRDKQETSLDKARQQLAISWFDQVHVVELASGKTIFQADHGTYDPFFLGFSANGSKLVASGWDHLNIWDIEQGKKVVNQSLGGDNSSFADIDDDAQHYSYTSGDYSPRFQIDTISKFLGRGKTQMAISEVRHAKASKDGSLIAVTASEDEILHIISTSDQSTLARLSGGAAETYDDDFFFVNQNKNLLVRSDSSVFHLWNIEQQEVVHSWDTNYSTDKIAVSDNLLLITDENEFTLRAWDLTKPPTDENIVTISLNTDEHAKGDIIDISISENQLYYSLSVGNVLENLMNIYVVDAKSQKIIGQYTTDLAAWSADFANNDQYLVIDSYPIEVLDWQKSEVVYRLSRNQ